MTNLQNKIDAASAGISIDNTPIVASPPLSGKLKASTLSEKIAAATSPAGSPIPSNGTNGAQLTNGRIGSADFHSPQPDNDDEDNDEQPMEEEETHEESYHYDDDGGGDAVEDMHVTPAGDKHTGGHARIGGRIQRHEEEHHEESHDYSYHDEQDDHGYFEQSHHSERRRSLSPSAQLLMTTNNRRNDAHELQRIRQSQDGLDEPVAIKTNFSPPSENLLKTTQSRICEIRDRESKKGEIRDEDDPFWEKRKPAQPAAKLNVESKLYKPTTSYLKSQRAKVQVNKVTEKHAIDNSMHVDVQKISKIENDSALLRPTKNTVGKNWNASPPPPPSPSLSLSGMSTGPQHVQSRLLDDTIESKAQKYKTKEQLQREHKAAGKHLSSPKKVKGPSEHLVAFNTNMRRQSREKATKPEQDPRCAGWDRTFVNDRVISKNVDGELMPLPPITYIRDTYDGGNVDASEYEMQPDAGVGASDSNDLSTY